LSTIVDEKAYPQTTLLLQLKNTLGVQLKNTAARVSQISVRRPRPDQRVPPAAILHMLGPPLPVRGADRDGQTRSTACDL